MAALFTKINLALPLLVDICSQFFTINAINVHIYLHAHMHVVL